MDAVGVVLIGVGGWLLYAAYKNEHPWDQLMQIIEGGQAGAQINSAGGLPVGAATEKGIAAGAAALRGSSSGNTAATRGGRTSA